MAQRVNIVLVDDIDGSDAEETISFGIDGANYEIDLNAANATALREAVAPYVGHARRAGGSRRGGRRTTTPSGPSAKEVREWARQNGWDVPARGRVSAEVRQAYDAAH